VLQGIVVKAYNGYYYVQSHGKTFMCKLRGRFKKERFSLVVGDEVEFDMVGKDTGIIEVISPRRSMLKRPVVANVDQVIVTFAAANPDLNTALVDRFLILAELSRLTIILCINKIDFADRREVERVVELYRGIGYTVLAVSALQAAGICELAETLYDKVTVFAGPSGVGKSSILNQIEPGLQLTTGEVSEKIGRGKHTTRFAQLLPLTGGGFVVDTPGFSSTQFDDVEEAQLTECFPEFREVLPYCKYGSCLHYKEPQCAVKQAVADGSIHSERYESYLQVLTEIRESRKGF
jgi:ribosome biogenesis GTPase